MGDSAGNAISKQPPVLPSPISTHSVPNTPSSVSILDGDIFDEFPSVPKGVPSRNLFSIPQGEPTTPTRSQTLPSRFKNGGMDMSWLQESEAAWLSLESPEEKP